MDQNTAARLITKTRKYCSITPALMYLHWLPVQQGVKYKVLVFAFRCLHGLAPQYLSDLLPTHVAPRSLRSASSIQLNIPKVKCRYIGGRAFSVGAPQLWNKLPVSVRNCGDILKFKRELKTLLFAEAFTHCKAH
jgi:hypothetical protein